jgi:hypothetical protein
MRARRAFTGTVVGLDLSLTGAAGCALPCPWDGDLSRVRMMPMAGYGLKKDASVREQLDRIITIRDVVYEFCREVQARKVGIEDYAFSAAGRITMLAELGGSVKTCLWEDWATEPEIIKASSARKVLLQKLPAKDSKLFTQVNVRSIGPIASKWNDDEIDAFVIANTVLMNAGGTALTFPGSWLPRET